MTNINDILKERQKTHGDFESQASMSATLKRIIHDDMRGWRSLSDTQQEALDHIIVKISRILNGDHNFVGHYEDIIGYCQLVINSLSPYPGCEKVEEFEDEIPF